MELTHGHGIPNHFLPQKVINVFVGILLRVGIIRKLL